MPYPKSINYTATTKEYQTRVRLAFSIVYLNIEFCRIIENIDDPLEAWLKLKTHFQLYNRAWHMQLFSEVLSCHKEPDESVDICSMSSMDF